MSTHRPASCFAAGKKIVADLTGLLVKYATVHACGAVQTVSKLLEELSTLFVRFLRRVSLSCCHQMGPTHEGIEMQNAGARVHIRILNSNPFWICNYA